MLGSPDAVLISTGKPRLELGGVLCNMQRNQKRQAVSNTRGGKRLCQTPSSEKRNHRRKLLVVRSAALVLSLVVGGNASAIADANTVTGTRNTRESRTLQLVQAIYKAEGGDKAAVPYGLIYSAWCKQEPGWCAYYASEIVAINYERWLRRGKPGEFIDWLGSTYCPPSAHKLNRAWTKNVKHFYKRSTGSAQFELEERKITETQGVRG